MGALTAALLWLRGAPATAALAPFDPAAVTRVSITHTPHEVELVARDRRWSVVLEADRMHGAQLQPAEEGRVHRLVAGWSAGLGGVAAGPPGGPTTREAAALGLSRGDVTRLRFDLVDGTSRAVAIGAGDDGVHSIRIGESPDVLQAVLPTELPSADPAGWLDRRLFPRAQGAVVGFRADPAADWDAPTTAEARTRLDRILSLRWTRTLGIGGNFHNYEDALPVVAAIAIRTDAGVEQIEFTSPDGRPELVYALVDNALLQLDAESAATLRELAGLKALR